MNRALAALFFAALPLAVFAQAYKWKDRNGQVHYSQVPPKDVQAEVVAPPPPPSSNPNQESLNKSMTDAQKAAPEKQQAADAAAQVAQQRQAACKDAITRLAYLDAHTPRRLATKDAQGNVSRMTDEEFARQRTAEQDKIKQNCD
jgi:hypothetical protein